MNARALDLDEVFTGEVRFLQAAYPEAHEALRNWGLWSRDRAGILPGMGVNSIWEQFIHDPDKDGYADPDEAPREPVRLPVAAKSEKAETPGFNEKEAVELDEFLHGPKGLNYDIRRCLLAAYVTWDTHEPDWPRIAGCTEAEFLTYLDVALVRAGGGLGR